jgi:hypothetical protein
VFPGLKIVLQLCSSAMNNDKSQILTQLSMLSSARANVV